MYFISDEKMLGHCIRWDSYHIESPDRMTVIIDRLKVLFNSNQKPYNFKLISRVIYSIRQIFFLLDLLLLKKLRSSILKCISIKLRTSALNR